MSVDPRTPLALLAEFIGAFILITTILISGDPLAIGLSLAVMAYAFGPVSGAHLNPAVLGGVAAYGMYRAYTNSKAITNE